MHTGWLLGVRGSLTYPVAVSAANQACKALKISRLVPA